MDAVRRCIDDGIFSANTWDKTCKNPETFRLKGLLYCCNQHISRSIMFTLNINGLCFSAPFSFTTFWTVSECLQTSRRLPCKLLATAATCLQLNSHRETFGAALYPTTRLPDLPTVNCHHFSKSFFFCLSIFIFSSTKTTYSSIMWFYIMHYITVCSTVCFTEMMLHFVGYSIWL